MINGHGDDAYTYQTPLIANFSSNVVPGGTSILLLDFLKDNLEQIASYPEAGAESFQKQLANHHVIEESQILVTNGATEAFYLIAQTFKGQRSLIHVPSFAEYEDACKVNDHQLITKNIAELSDID
ncbi:MAG: aminotransferase class I/II-fold pyridoxal phosphate-dependent enzyme, partial [Bacteroidales bacterium]|nr:aminotransferase class I/II-fold pyridoxal phosphate-dependent enzyme [Bacteroidales bacterium]